MLNLIYIVLALLGLGFLIFIHELGHYFMGRKVGMKVEVFSIGFGRPFRVWEWQGVKWQLCILPFGGYVRFAGMEKKGGLEPHQIPEGFFGKRPIDRIKVALMGPLVNIAFALLVFSLIWVSGGRLKSFSAYTKVIGWIDPQSKLAKEGLKPGDQFLSVDGTKVGNLQDLLYGVVFSTGPLTLEADKVDYWTGQQKPFYVPLFQEVKPTLEQKINEVQSIVPASFLVYNRYPDGQDNSLENGSPMQQSGIKYGDRIVWVDGEIVFSLSQLSSIINQPRVLLTVKRGDETFLARVPRLALADLQIKSDEKAEIDDWRNEARLSTRLSSLYFIPYRLSSSAVVEKSLTYIDENSQHCVSFNPLEQNSCSPLERPLLPGDKILAVDGRMVSDVFEFLSALQERKILIAVSSEESTKPMLWKNADSKFIHNVEWPQLKRMIATLGTSNYLPTAGNLRFLEPVTPKALIDFPESKNKNLWLKDQTEAKKQIEKIRNPQEKQLAKRALEVQQKKMRLGIVLQDEQVRYNPNPFSLFGSALLQTWHTLKGLVTGHITPKAISGPVAMVQVMHFGWMLGVKEALYWIGLISLNLGIFNLLPIPVLDGGHICFALWEALTKKPIKAKTMERLVIPFIIALVALLIFTTYQDLLRLFK
jgi:regulator of sigma E protease